MAAGQGTGLTSPPRALHERLSNARDGHTLAAWEAQRERWQRLRERLTARTGTAELTPLVSPGGAAAGQGQFYKQVKKPQPIKKQGSPGASSAGVVPT